MGKRSFILWFVILILCVSASAGAQSRLDTLILDSIKIAPKSKFISKWVKVGIQSIEHHPKIDTAKVGYKSEDAFSKAKGKVIRKIIVKRIGFEQTVADTNSRLLYWGTQVLNDLHTKTKEWVIRQNLFIHEGDTVEPYKIADNERFLRNLPHIQDAKIYVRSFMSMPDTVDLIIVTRDLFSITGGLGIGSITNANGQLADVNFLGMGQRVEIDGLYDQNRHPDIGFQALYKKYNVGGSFVDATIGYTLINPNGFDGNKEETAGYLQLSRPLISPNAKFAGGLTLSHRYTDNHYPKRVDTLFYKYSGNVYDGWIGYNFASKKLEAHDIRDRKFVAFRYAQNYFSQVPYQVGDRYDLIFNDAQLALGALTFFRQDFYKTNYIYGFGTTEDIPYGYRVTATTGWYKQLNLSRPYLGVNAIRFVITNQEDFARYYFKAGAFYDNGKLTDAGVMAGASIFSRLFKWNGYKMRQYFAANYTHLFDIITNEPLRIDNIYGLPYFSYAFLNGYERLSLSSESMVFLRRKLFGFRFAPFADANFSLLTPNNATMDKADIYTGIGGGLRARNENLVFGTLELKGIYFPRKVGGIPAVKITFTSNLRFRYNSNYVSAPDIVRYNLDDIE